MTTSNSESVICCASHFSSFGRSIAGTGEEQDVDLDGEYYVLFGGSHGSTSSGFLIAHRSASPPTNPDVTEQRFSIVGDIDAAQPKNAASLQVTMPVYHVEVILASLVYLMFSY